MFSVETLHFQRMKEAFHAGIIVAIALCAHTAILIMLLLISNSRSEECLLILLFAVCCGSNTDAFRKLQHFTAKFRRILFTGLFAG